MMMEKARLCATAQNSKAANKPGNDGRAKAWLWLALELERWPARLQHAEHGTAEGTKAEL
jgi:hypothetical protein